MPQAPRIPTAEWEAHKALIKDLWINQNKTLDEVMQYMAELGFCPSRPQWIRKINVNWKLRKNSTKEEWQHASSLLSKRKGNGKDTDLVMNGKIVSSKKRMKELKRYSTLQTDQVSQDSSQFHAVVVSTPPASGQREISYRNLQSLHIRDDILSCVRSSNMKEPRAYGPSHVSLQQHVPTRTVHNIGSFPSNKDVVLDPSYISKAVSRTIQMVDEMFPVSNFHQDKEHSQQPVWVQLFQALLIISTNDLWNDIKTSFKCTDHLLYLVLPKGHLRDLETLLIATKETNGKLATHLLFGALKIDSDESLALMRFLLRRDVGPNSNDPRPSPNSSWWTALHKAVYWDSHRSVKLLIESGADPHPYSDTALFIHPLEISLQHINDCSITELSTGADEFDTSKRYGHDHEIPPLFLAIRNRSIRCAQILLDAGADPNYFHPSLLTPLHIAIGMRNVGIVKMLTKAGALPNLQLGAELHARLPNITRVVELHKVKSVLTPLQAAVQSESTPIVEYLLCSGARPDRAVDREECQNYELYYTESVQSCVQISALTGNYAMMSLLLTSDANPNSRHQGTPTALQTVCGSASMSPLERYHATSLLLRHGADINASPAPQAGRTALQAAVEVSDYHLANFLLKKGADPNMPSTPGGVTAMEAAIKCGSLAIRRLLIDNGNLEDNLHPGNNERTHRRYFDQAISAGNIGLLQSILMVGNGPELPLSDEDAQHAVKVAIAGGALSLVQELLSMYQQLDRSWVLCETVWQGKYEILEWMLSWLPRSMLNLSSRRKPSPLWIAVHQRNRRVVQHLLQAGADPNIKSFHTCPLGSRCFRNGQRELPIRQAISPGHGRSEEGADMVELLVSHGAQVNRTLNGNSRPLLLALKEGKYDTADLLIHKGANPNFADKKDTVIHYALRAGNYALVKSLIDHGADLRNPSSWGSPIQDLVHCRIDNNPDAVQGLVKTCRLLFELGADVNASPNEYCTMTALQKAVDCEAQELIEVLLEARADIHAPAFYDGGRTALQAAAKTGNFKLVKRLVEMGADINAPAAEKGGATALQYAAILGHVNMAILLLEKGASVNATRSFPGGFSALQGASKYGRLDMIHLLLENDQDPDTIEKRCQDSAKIAEAKGYTQVAELLRGHKRP